MSEISTPIVHGGPGSMLVILAVDDLARAAGFYDTVFGWHRVAGVPVYIEYRLPSGSRLGIYERNAFAGNTGVVPGTVAAGGTSATELYLYVDDLEPYIARLRAAGARELSARAPRLWGDEAAYFADHDGNVVAVARPLDEE